MGAAHHYHVGPSRAVGPNGCTGGLPRSQELHWPRWAQNRQKHTPSPRARLPWGGRLALLSGNELGGTLSQRRVLAGKRLQEAPFLTQVDIISQSHEAWLTGATKTRQGKADFTILRAQAPDLAFLITDRPGRRVDRNTFL